MKVGCVPVSTSDHCRNFQVDAMKDADCERVLRDVAIRSHLETSVVYKE